MGQQQLLLVILVTIIVGIATVVAINTFGTQADSANRDAVRQDIVAAISNARAFYQKPAMMGGGGKDFTSTNGQAITIGDLNIPGVTGNSSPSNQNENGTYSISTTATTITITGSPSSGGSDLSATLDMSKDQSSSDFVTWSS